MDRRMMACLAATVLMSTTPAMAQSSAPTAAAPTAEGATAASLAPPVAVPTTVPTVATEPPPATPSPAIPLGVRRHPVFDLGFSVIFKNPINLTTGGLAPVSLGFAANLSWRITDRALWCADVSIGTPLSAFVPSPGLSTGPCIVVAPHVIINPNLMYGMNMTFMDPAHSPSLNSGAWAVQHSIGANVAIGFPLRTGVILAFPVAVSYNLTTNQTALLFIVKLGFAIGEW